MTDEAAARAATLRPLSAELRRLAESAEPTPSFADALRKSSQVAVIAEVKRSSPSKGAINPTLDVAEQVRAYEAGAASAISILTEPKRFGGSNDDLVMARAATALPLLKKDFHVAVAQIFEAKALGASAALVIVRAVEPRLFLDLLDAGRDIGLDILVEVQDEAELELALIYRAEIIGVNNRNLETLEIDTGNAARVIPFIPAGVVAVAESGLKTADDVRQLADIGADAVLVGSELSGAADPRSAVMALTKFKRVRGARKG